MFSRADFQKNNEEIHMPKLSDYAGRFRNIVFERQDGILLMRLHTDGGPMKWGATLGAVHDQLGEAFYQVARDIENEVVILTGTGDVFCTEFNMDELPTDSTDHDAWYRIVREGKDLLMNLLDIDVPVIGVANGPALIHAELLALSDIVIAADTASFADLAHYPGNTVPGDGAHVVWPLLLGPNRGRYFLMIGEQIPAAEARTLGIVGEVLPSSQALPRAWELARQLAQRPRALRRNSRLALTLRLKRHLLEDLAHGLMLEGQAIG
jgi:enoyl-CoA hydratase/carnithine racemase